MIKDIQKVQKELESSLISAQPAVEDTALSLLHSDTEAMKRYLTNYSITQGERIVSRWRSLGEYLIQKYNDGYIRDENGRTQEVGYPDPWLREVIKSRSDQFRLPEKEKEVPETRLVD